MFRNFLLRTIVFSCNPVIVVAVGSYWLEVKPIEAIGAVYSNRYLAYVTNYKLLMHKKPDQR